MRKKGGNRDPVDAPKAPTGARNSIRDTGPSCDCPRRGVRSYAARERVQSRPGDQSGHKFTTARPRSQRNMRGGKGKTPDVRKVACEQSSEPDGEEITRWTVHFFGRRVPPRAVPSGGATASTLRNPRCNLEDGSSFSGPGTKLKKLLTVCSARSTSVGFTDAARRGAESSLPSMPAPAIRPPKSG